MQKKSELGYNGNMKNIRFLNYVLSAITFVLSVLFFIVLTKWKYSTRSDVNLQYAWYTVFIGIPLLFTSLFGAIFGGVYLLKKSSKSIFLVMTFVFNTTILLKIVFDILKSFIK